MCRRIQKSLLACLLLLIHIALTGCNKIESNHPHSNPDIRDRHYLGEYPIRAVCTTGQVGEMIARIGGDTIHVDCLMGPGVDPHLYKPIASDVQKLRNADIIFYNGLHLEGRMAALFEKMSKNKPTFAVTAGLVSRNDPKLRKPLEFAGMYDPHVWHDVNLWATCVQDMAAELQKFDPRHEEQYNQNVAEYLAEFDDLNEFCEKQIAAIPEERRVLITAHDAFGYFGKAYGLEVFGLKGISTDTEKDLSHQEEIQRMIIERKIPAVFIESAVNKRTIEALVEPCRAAGFDLKIGGELFADAMGEAGTEESIYNGMIRHNVRTIVEALSKGNDQ